MGAPLKQNEQNTKGGHGPGYLITPPLTLVSCLLERPGNHFGVKQLVREDTSPKTGKYKWSGARSNVSGVVACLAKGIRLKVTQKKKKKKKKREYALCKYN